MLLKWPLLTDRQILRSDFFLIFPPLPNTSGDNPALKLIQDFTGQIKGLKRGLFTPSTGKLLILIFIVVKSLVLHSVFFLQQVL
jgi:hypothetical protein